MYRKGYSFLTAILFIFLTLSASTAQALEIKVGLAVQTPHLQIGSGSSITAVDGNGQKVSGSRFSIKPSGSGRITVGNRTMPHPVKFYSKSPLVFNNRKYRGYFMVLNSSAGLTLVNVVNMEDYLRGVLKMEVNPDWPTESLKAQSIISRTFAMKSRGRHGSEGFDVCDKSHCQVYRGINAEDPVLDRVIKSTNGIILKYGNSIASTFFHSDSGGATADVSTVWSSRIPYLRGSEEPFKYKSPYSDWKVSLSRNEVDRAVKKLGYHIGKVISLKVHESDPYGRANKILVQGSGGNAVIKAHTFRMAVGADRIKSTFFRIDNNGSSGTIRSSTPESERNDPRTSMPAPLLSFVDTGSSTLNPKEEKLMTTLTQQGYFTSREIIDMLLDPSKRKAYLLKAINRPQKESSDKKNYSSPSVVTGSSGGFVLSGSGWGHGVGLSQWGARNLALNGWDSRKILQHYFPGTRLENLY